MGLQRISWVWSPVSRNHNPPWLNQAEHLNAVLPSLHDGDKLTAEMVFILPGWGNQSKNPSFCWVCFCFSAQPQFSAAGKFLSACTSILSAVCWIYHSRDLWYHFLVTKEVYSNQQVPGNWTSRVTVAVFLLWMQVKGTLKPPQYPLVWSTGCFGIQLQKTPLDCFVLVFFPSKMELTIYKAITKIFIAVRFHGISYSELFIGFKKHTGVFICCIKDHLPPRLLCISGLLMCT